MQSSFESILSHPWYEKINVTDGDRKNFYKSDLKFKDFSNKNLNGCNFFCANLQYSNFQNCSLKNANLSYANLRYANFQDAILDNVNLQHAQLSGNFEGASFGNANLASANLQSANLIWANLEGANLSKANLRYAKIKKAALAGAILDQVKMEHADLSGSDFAFANNFNFIPEHKPANLENAYLRGTNFRNADLRGVSFRSADLSFAIFDGAKLFEAIFNNANLSNAQLRNAELNKADLSGANLSHADFSKSDLNEAIFRESTLINVNFTNAIFNHKKTNLEETKFFDEDSLPNPAILGEPYKKSTANYVNFHFPDQCQIHQNETLKIKFIANPSSFPPRSTENVRRSNKSLNNQKLYVHVTSPGFQIHPRFSTIEIPILQDSKLISFDLRPLKLGSQIIEIEMFIQTVRVGYYICKTMVRGHEA